MLRLCFASRAAAAASGIAGRRAPTASAAAAFHSSAWRASRHSTAAVATLTSASSNDGTSGAGGSGGQERKFTAIGGVAAALLATAFLSSSDWRGVGGRRNQWATATATTGAHTGSGAEQSGRRRRIVVAAPVGHFDSGSGAGAAAKRPTVGADAGDSRSLHKSALTRSATAAMPLAAVAAPAAVAVVDAAAAPPQQKAEAAPAEAEATGFGSVVTMSTETGLPSRVPYLIIGSGFAGMAAARAIRASDPLSKVLMIGDEPYPPYLRPPLSKELWRRKEDRVQAMLSPQGDMRRNSWLFVEPESFFIDPRRLHEADTGGVSLWFGRRAVALDVADKCVTLDSGDRVHYGKCLLATGGRPRTLPVFTAAAAASPEVASRTVTFRGIGDFQALRERAQRAKSVVVVGGGFLGCELAVSLAEVSKKTGLEVHQVFKEPGALAHVLPPYLAEHTASFIGNCGVLQYPGEQVTSVAWVPGSEAEDGRLAISLSSGRTLTADLAVVAVGIEANTQLAESAGLEVDPGDGGFLVNAELEARTDLFAAGDACSYYDVLLGRRRVEHVNHAEESGAVAGRNMAAGVAGAGPEGRQAYRHQSSFWCNLANTLAWDAVGLVDASLQTQAFFAAPPASEGAVAGAAAAADFQYPGVVFYIKAGRVVGILLWNLPDEVFQDKKAFAPSRLNLARKVLAERQLADPAALQALAREFDVYQTVDDDYQDLKKYMEEKERQQRAEAEGGAAAAAGVTASGSGAGAVTVPA